MQKNNAFNKFYFYPNFFSYRFILNFKIYVILENYGSFFQKKDSSQLYHSQFLKINSLIAETIEKQFSKNKIFVKKFLNWIIID